MFLFFLLSTFIQISTLCISIYIFLGRRLSLKLYLILVLGGVAIAFPLFYVMHASSILFVVLFYMISIYLILKKKALSSIVPITSLILMVISDHIVSLILIDIFKLSVTDIQRDSVYMILYVLAIFVVSTIISLLSKFIVSKYAESGMFFKRYGGLFAGVTILTVIIFYTNIWFGQQQGFTDDNIRANSLLFFFYMILLIGVFMILYRTVIKEMKMQNQKLEYERLSEYTENLEELYSDMQKFRHDYINILSTMSEYIRTRDIDNLEKFFTSKIIPISQDMQSNTYKLGTLKNVKLQELKGILSSKLIKAQEMNIDAMLEAVEPIEALNMDSIQLCRCMGIIMDNAIEEAKQCVNPELRVALIKRENSTLIVTINSCRPDTPELYKIYEKGFSTKGENRGLGLSNLKDIVAQCDNVTLDTAIHEGQFIQKLEILQ